MTRRTTADRGEPAPIRDQEPPAMGAAPDEAGRLTPHAQLGAFLRSRRARLGPADVGLPASPRRRATGLRREEVAALGGMSTAWYTQLEQGRDVRPSRDGLAALARALRLDETERAYLFQLAYGGRDHARAVADSSRPVSAASTRPAVCAVASCPTPEAPDGTPAPIRRLLDALPVPAFVIDRCWDVVGRNAALAALMPGLAPERTTPDAPPRNVVAYALTNAAWRATVPEWARLARAAVEGLRASLAGVRPDEPDAARATALVAALEQASPEFRSWWPQHGLWVADRAMTHVHEHPSVGRIALEATMLDVRSAPGLTLITYVPCDATSAGRLRRLTATTAPAQR